MEVDAHAFKVLAVEVFSVVRQEHREEVALEASELLLSEAV